MKLSRRFALSGLAVVAAAPAAAKTSQIKDLQAAIDKAVEADGALVLPAGTYETPGVRIDKPVHIQGVAGLTKITSPAGGPILVIEAAGNVTLSGLSFIGDRKPVADDNQGAAMVMAGDTARLVIDDCRFEQSSLIGLRLESCGGRVRDCSFADIDASALFALDSKGLEISGNTITRMGTNGIQVWTREPAEDGTIISGNRISHVSYTPGDTGQTGNGISVFKAGNVTIAGNRISDCAYSGIRNNSGSNCQITGNSISRTGEVALYCEFAFQGAVVSGNLMEDVRHGISITNFDVGGRLAVCANNLVRRSQTGGISVEAQTTVTGNVVEDCIEVGISLGWAWGAKALSAANNIVVNCGRGITFSVAEGAEPAMIVNNRITGSRQAAIVAMNYTEAASGDLALAGADVPTGSVISGNITG